MLRGLTQAGRALQIGQWSQQSAKLKSGNAPAIRRKVVTVPHHNVLPALWFTSFSWIPGPTTSIVGYPNHLRSYAALLARMDVIRMLYIHQVSNKVEASSRPVSRLCQIRMQAGRRRSGPSEVLPGAGGMGVKSI